MPVLDLEQGLHDDATVRVTTERVVIQDLGTEERPVAAFGTIESFLLGIAGPLGVSETLGVDMNGKLRIPWKRLASPFGDKSGSIPEPPSGEELPTDPELRTGPERARQGGPDCRLSRAALPTIPAPRDRRRVGRTSLSVLRGRPGSDVRRTARQAHLSRPIGEIVK